MDPNDPAQRVLDRIHVTSLRIQSYLEHCMQSHDILLIRSFNSVLNSISNCTSSLFRSKGENYSAVEAKLNDYDGFLTKLAKKLPVTITDKTNGELLQKSIQRHRNDSKILLTMGLEYKPLIYILDAVREVERSFDFQLALHDSKLSMQKLHPSISLTQYTYGTTYFSTWREICHMSSMRVIERRCKEEGRNMKICIFGSSHGLLCFYTAFLCSHCDVYGYEILPFLHDIAMNLHNSCPASVQDRVHLNQQDMFDANISDADVVILTSLCWDDSTRKQIAKKLCRELPSDSIVIDYQESTFSIVKQELSSVRHEQLEEQRRNDNFFNILNKCTDTQLLQCLGNVVSNISRSQHEMAKFKLREILSASVSWSNNQMIYVYQSVRQLPASDDSD